MVYTHPSNTPPKYNLWADKRKQPLNKHVFEAI